MTIQNSPPSHDPASEDILAGLIYESMRKLNQNTNDMLPARVVDYDRATNRAHVQPLIMLLTTDGERIQRQGVQSVPVTQLGAGGFVMSFNLVAGDLGWIKANDRDISLFLQSYAESEPNSRRFHSFSDAVFIPDVMTGYTIAGEDAGNMVIQNLAGTVKIALWPNKIKVVAPLVEVVTPSATFSADVTIAGSLVVNGTTHSDGNITTDADAFAGDISLKEHGHKDVQAGGSNSGKSVVI